MKSFEFLTITAVFLTSHTLGFLVEKPCPTTPPCTCGAPDTNTIYCNDKQLTSFPTFKTTPRTFPTININIQHNAITSVPDDAFLPLSSMITTTYSGSINLDDNQITTFADNAFNGITDKINKLYLNQNNLTTIPAALANLTHLDTIQIEGNPISVLDATTMSAVGKTLFHLYIDIDHFATWPTELGLMTKIFDLKLLKIPFTKLPSDSFQNWTRMGSLEISDSQLHGVPEALCELNSSFAFYFNNNFNLKQDSPVFPDCTNATGTLGKVRSVTLKNNNLLGFSNIFSTFSVMYYLTLTQNPKMRYVIDDEIPDNYTLSYVTLDHNGFDRIPEALQKLHGVYVLDLSFNLITTIQRHDLDGFDNLHTIKLNGNPLVYVSSEAFLSSVLITTIYMQNTNLTQIPHGVVGLRDLSQLDLHGSPIECTCESMGFFKTWVDHVYWFTACNGTCVYLNGLCVVRQINIGEYMKGSLKNC